ncbi:hypothetical protein TSOC_012183, partial [Tetrabaena socialis]
MPSSIHLLHDLATKRTGRLLEDYAPSVDLECARAKLSAPGHQYLEVLSTAKTPVTKFYLDRDQLLDSKPTDAEVALALAEVHEKLAKLLGGHLEYKIAQRHGFCPSKGRYKLSFRPFIRYTDIPAIVRACSDDDFWDLSVYKGAEQLLACPNGRKGHGDDRILRMAREDDDIADYLAQVTDNSWQLLALPDDFNDDCPTQSQDQDRTENQNLGDLDQELVRDALRCISATRAGKYAEWRDICFGLKSSGLDLLEDFKAFSRRAPGYDTRAHQKACDVLWAKSRGGEVTIGTVFHFAKADDPVEYARAWSRFKERRSDVQIIRHSDGKGEVQNEEVLLAARRLGEIVGFGGPIARVLASRVKGPHFIIDVIMEDDSEATITLDVETLLVQVQQKDQEQEIIKERYINATDAIDVPGIDLACLHKDLRSGMNWQVTRPDDTKAVFCATGSRVELLNVDHPGKESATLAFLDSSRKTVAVRKGQVTTLQDAYRGAIQAALQGPLNMGFLVNYGTINLYNSEPSSESNRRPDDDLAHLVIQTHPDAFARIVFAPDVKSSNCNGLYFCDEDTNVWSQEHNGTMEEKVMSLFKSGSQSGSLVLTEKELHYIASRRGRADMLHIVACKLANKGFKASLDSNRDIFPVANGCFDTSLVPGRTTWRALTLEDRVSIVAPWAYCPELAREKRAEVDRFLAQVLPIAEERSVVLTFFANLMSGRRCAKKFLVLTDKSGGDNGKSTLLALFSLFFASFAETNTKFVCKGSFDRDRDSHDAGMEPMKGKRLIVAEELKHDMTLDDALLKRLTGGDGVTISGRQCGSGSRFEFTWQAGIVMLFNEGDCPKFDAGDTAFMGRMLVAPMRAKFIDPLRSEVSDDPYQFPMVANIQEKFPSWLPALADIFTDHFAPLELFNSVPPAMKEWRREITQEANPISEWLEREVVITRN